MKRITLLMVAFLGSIALQAQNVIIEQTTGGTTGVPAGYFESAPGGIYLAEDFQLTGSTDITSITLIGFDNSETLMNGLTEVSFYVYADASGFPAGDPTQTGTGVLEVILPVGDPALTIDHTTGDALYSFTVDIAAATGSALNLSAGTYWLTGGPTVDATVPVTGTNPFTGGWYALNSTDIHYDDALLFDPTGILTTDGSPIPWTNASTAYAEEKYNGFSFIVNGTPLSIEDQVLAEVSLYPNPMQDQLNINLPNSIELESATMFDLLGQQTVMNIGENNTLNTSNLASGVYILKLETNQGTMTKKVIKK